VSDIAWDDVRVDFDPEMNGTLPDVVVEHVGMGDWQAVLDLVRTQGWTYEYEGDAGNCDDLPTAQEFFAQRDRGAPIKVWPVAGIQVNFWALDVDTIDFDVDLRELQGQERLDRLCDLIRTIGRLLHKPVEMMAEGYSPPRYRILGYDVHADQVVMLATPTTN